MSKAKRDLCRDLLLRELIPALGCTEPISLALAAAMAKELLDGEPEDVQVYCSSNILKNANSVIVPNSGGRKGVKVAVALGIVGGQASLGLNVLENVKGKDIEKALMMIEEKRISVHLSENKRALFIQVEVRNKNSNACAVIQDKHNRFTYLSKGQEIIFNFSSKEPREEGIEDRSFLSIGNIVDYSNNVDLEQESELREALLLQWKLNKAIGMEGLNNQYGCNIGKLVKKISQDNNDCFTNHILAVAASDARMGGCSLPVVINSGSGNQGLTASLPVIQWGDKQHVDQDKILRALIVSNLTAIYIKHGIGMLSAFCGAVSAAAGAGAGIAYLINLDIAGIAGVVSNTLAVASGILCDGAKASCAGKIALALQAMELALKMAEQGYAYSEGDGIVGCSVDETIKNIGIVVSVGMRETDEEILNIMLKNSN